MDRSGKKLVRTGPERHEARNENKILGNDLRIYVSREKKAESGERKKHTRNEGEAMTDMYVILLIVVMNGILGFVQEYRAEQAVEALKAMVSPHVLVLRSGKEQDIDSKELVPGDIVLLEAGSRVPADCRLIEAANLEVDEAALTGESRPVNKRTVQVADDAGRRPVD